tara:strand:- start:3024 stop:4103 length:1080 start_codon:yes stop_codon:yes gene_type:complete
MQDLENNKTVKSLRVNNLSKRFGEIPAVANVSFDVEEGSIMALLGPSGCGKTTTLRLIAGFESPEKGNIELNGEVVANSDIFIPPEKRHVGMVFQDYALFPHLSVFDNVAFGLKRNNRKVERNKNLSIKNGTQKALSLVGLSRFHDKMPHELSGGEQQRVALARALAPEPSILLLDEPFSNLDAALRKKLRSDVKLILKQAGCSTVFVTHDQDEAFLLADQIGLMLNGNVVQVGTPLDVYSNPVNLNAAALLGDTNIIEGIAQNGKVETFIGQHLTNSDVNGKVNVLIRPESITIMSSISGDSNGEIIEKEFYGDHEVIIIQLSSKELLRVPHPPNSKFAVGTNVSVRVTSPLSIFKKK